MASVLIYRDQLLPGSETFVREQARYLPTYQSYFAGMKFIPGGIPLPTERTVIVNRRGWFGRVKEVLAQFVRFPPSFLRTAEAWNPDLIHAHFGPDAVNALRLARHLEVPLAVTYHGYDATVRDEHARQSFYRHRAYLRHRERVKREVDCFIAVSDFIKRELIEKDFPEDRIVQHYVGIDVDMFEPSPNVEREDVILFVGRLVESKGGEYLIRAGARIQKRHPNVEVVFVGNGPLKSDLEVLAEQVGCSVRFVGHQPPSRVRDWLNQARVFCVPSVVAETGAEEGFGIVFAEAQAMGVPVVSFESGGIPEVVKHEKTGLLAPETDWKQLADHIEHLLTNPELWKRYSQAGHERVSHKFDVRQQSKNLESIYNRLVRDQR